MFDRYVYLASFSCCHLGVTLKCLKKENMVLTDREEPITAMQYSSTAEYRSCICDPACFLVQCSLNQHTSATPVRHGSITMSVRLCCVYGRRKYDRYTAKILRPSRSVPCLLGVHGNQKVCVQWTCNRRV